MESLPAWIDMIVSTGRVLDARNMLGRAGDWSESYLCPIEGLRSSFHWYGPRCG